MSFDEPAGEVAAEEAMPGGIGNNGAGVRVGDTVRRPVGRHTAGVQAFLAHLRARGFTGAPEPLGYDEAGREVLSYVPGDVAVQEDPPAWVTTDEALVSVVRLVRALHDAAAGFVAPDGFAWAWPAAPEYRRGLFCHNDPCRENVVFRDGLAVALIDFDWAGPSSPEWELAGLLAHFVLRLPGDRVARTRLVCATYGIEPGPVVDAALRRMLWGMELVRARAAAGHPGFVTMMAQGHEEKTQALYDWLLAHRDRLR
jgi:hypothetical protein